MVNPIAFQVALIQKKNEKRPAGADLFSWWAHRELLSLHASSTSSSNAVRFVVVNPIAFQVALIQKREKTSGC
ncbi:MAG: hypothetical protein AUJ47_07835 [Candidatus Marinimicrobia bacterium CG1_02_48_14]|nr:MAG: hypothetical protein AUJ47_07835 [Candidatus Marinimicrobia bacterium CG1_02_48_14]